MIELLKQIDTNVFIAINHLPHNFFLDTFFGFLTFLGYAGAVWVVVTLLLYFHHKNKYKNLLKAVIWADILTLISVEVFLKNIIRRPRPQFEILSTILPFDITQSFSFPSGHATAAFAACFILGKLHKKWAWAYYLLAILISFSRIYLGKHYPIDVLAGACWGLLIGYLSIKIADKNFSKK